MRIDTAVMGGFVLGMWQWSYGVFRPAQHLKRAGLYPCSRLGDVPRAHPRPGGGAVLSRHRDDPVLLDGEPEGYGSVREFDTYAETYERFVQPFSGPIVDETIALMRPYLGPAARVLDPSAGPGRNAMRLAREVVPGGEVVAADLSRGMVTTAHRSARAAGLTNMAFYQADVACPHPELDGYFDAVFCCLSFHHYPDAPAAARTFKRVLAPGGTCFIADAGMDWFILMTEPISYLTDPGFVRHRNGRELMALLTGAGFDPVGWTEILPGIGVAIGRA